MYALIQKLDSMGANQTRHIAELRYPVQPAPVLSVVKFLEPNCLAASNEAIAWMHAPIGPKQPPLTAFFTQRTS